MEKTKKIIVEFCRILLGCIFVFSGFVKAVDPLGSAYKFQDYFTALGFEWFQFISLSLSFGLSAIEFSLGVCILTGVYRKFTAILTLLFMLVMTPLTLYLAIKNPVTDCGCFGDALIISNWETFCKNIVLLAAAVFLFLWHKKITSLFSNKAYSLVIGFTYVFILLISFYCYRNLPILDFRPYKIGANIPQLMVIPEGAPHDLYGDPVFIYEKNGEKKEFTLDNYPANDTTWKFVDQISHLIKKGYQPPIHDFTITMQNGEEITDVVLSDSSYTFLLVSTNLKKTNESNVDCINEIYDFCKEHGYQFYCITASTPDEIEYWKENAGAEYPICTTDLITLKTIIRSNPGLLLLKNGTILNKWHFRNIPSNEELTTPLEKSELGKIAPDNDTKELITVSLLLLIPLAIFYWGDYPYRKKSKKEKTTDKEKE